MSEGQPHIPVMLNDVMAAFGSVDGQHIVDGTFGAGGYSTRLLEAGASVTGFDRDPDAVAGAEAFKARYGDRFAIVQAPFSEMGRHFEDSSLDGVVLDVGVSSMQLDQAERGFSFQGDGPLDMRMAQSGITAADVVNGLALNDLIRVIGILGDEKQASRIAKAIDQARQVEPIVTTGQLARIIEKAVPRKPKDKIHPATRSFQALRILVNDELRELGRALFAAERLLKPGGRLVVVSFHSLEDRMVKRFFADRLGQQGGSRHLPQVEMTPVRFEKIGKAMVVASDAEASENPRARSAKLRAAMRTDAPAGDADLSLFALANLPWINPSDTELRGARR